MNTLTFNHEMFGSLRTVVLPDGQIGFVGKDVAEALGYARTADAIRQHVDGDDKGVFKIPTPGGWQQTTIISESGLYALILASKLPTAKKFKHWVTAEVLPQIRQTGGYIPVSREDDEKTILCKALNIYMSTVKRQKEEIADKEQQIDLLTPLADYADNVLLSPTCYTMTQVAKSLSMTVQELQHALHEKGIIYRAPSGMFMLYAPYLKRGLEAYRTSKSDCRPDRPLWTDTYLVWTERGKMFIHSLFAKVA